MSDSTCYRCDWYLDNETGDICRVQGIGYFDVEKARKLIKRLRKTTVIIPKKHLSKMVGRDVHKPHLAHVNIRKVGIVGQYKDADGELYDFLLEGNHRATRRLREKKPFRAYRLTAEETRLIYLGKRAPNGMKFISKAA